MELRSPDPTANPYLAYALLIRAGLDGIQHNIPLPLPTDLNLFHADAAETAQLQSLPLSLDEAAMLARESKFVASVLPEAMRACLLA